MSGSSPGPTARILSSKRNSTWFEDAVSAAVDLMKEKIVRTKEKKFDA